MPNSAEHRTEHSGEHDVDEESARRLVLLALGALIAFVLSAGVALAVSRNDDSSSAGGVRAGGVGSVEDALIGTGTGPLAGTDVATYEAGRRRALGEAKGRWAAVVSLRDYMTQEAFTEQFGAYQPEAVLVATPGGESEVVTGDVRDWAEQARAAAEEERKELQSMLDTSDDKAFKDQFASDIDRIGKLLENLDPTRPVVFGFVVSGSTAELRRLAGRPDVRLVDLVARKTPSSLVYLRGLRPEETVKSGEPRTRPV